MSSFARKIERNGMKNRMGSNHIRYTWWTSQRLKYGNYLNHLHFKCNDKRGRAK